MSDARPVNLSSGLPNTVLAPEPGACSAALRDALGLEDPAARRSAVAAVVSDFPRSLDGWARLGDLARDDVEAYACYRVGYHRGLDALRASGWRGSGYVRWVDESNRGFLRSLRGLRDVAGRIGEEDEQTRCDTFLEQLDPGGVPDRG